MHCYKSGNIYQRVGAARTAARDAPPRWQLPVVRAPHSWTAPALHVATAAIRPSHPPRLLSHLQHSVSYLFTRSQNKYQMALSWKVRKMQQTQTNHRRLLGKNNVPGVGLSKCRGASSRYQRSIRTGGVSPSLAYTAHRSAAGPPAHGTLASTDTCHDADTAHIKIALLKYI